MIRTREARTACVNVNYDFLAITKNVEKDDELCTQHVQIVHSIALQQRRNFLQLTL